MIEEIGEPIDVVAAFSAGKISPILFSWRHRRYINLKVTSIWSDTEGDARQFHISVLTDSSNLYELCFRTRNFQWTLAKIYHE
jgi:hypothetical protein